MSAGQRRFLQELRRPERAEKGARHTAAPPGGAIHQWAASRPEVLWGGVVEIRSAPTATEELVQKRPVHSSRGDRVAQFRWYRRVADRCRPLYAAAAASSAPFMANTGGNLAAACRLERIGRGMTCSGIAVATTGGSCGVPGTPNTRLPTARYAIFFHVCICLLNGYTSTSTTHQTFVQVVSKND